MVEGAPQAADRRRLESVDWIHGAAASREVWEALISWMGQRNARPVVLSWTKMGELVAGLVLLQSMTMAEGVLLVRWRVTPVRWRMLLVHHSPLNVQLAGAECPGGIE